MKFQKFLDSDQRPGAKPISASAAEVFISDNGSLRFHGTLGAIPAEVEGNYVGFSGVEIEWKDQDLICLKGDQIEFCLNDVKPVGGVLTVHLIVGSESPLEEEKIFAMDVSASLNLMQLKLSQFRESHRGKYRDQFFDGQKSIVKVRIFFRRSQNSAESTLALDIGFQLVKI